MRRFNRGKILVRLPIDSKTGTVTSSHCVRYAVGNAAQHRQRGFRFDRVPKEGREEEEEKETGARQGGKSFPRTRRYRLDHSRFRASSDGGREGEREGCGTGGRVLPRGLRRGRRKVIGDAEHAAPCVVAVLGKVRRSLHKDRVPRRDRLRRVGGVCFGRVSMPELASRPPAQCTVQGAGGRELASHALVGESVSVWCFGAGEGGRVRVEAVFVLMAFVSEYF